MPVTVAMAVIMGSSDMFMAMGAAMAICPAFGREGGVNLLHARAQMFEHVTNNRIVLDQQMIG